VWRGVRARRAFSDLFFEAVEAELCGGSASSPSGAAGSPRDPSRLETERGAGQPSLEEAHEEAQYKYNHHITNETAPALAIVGHRKTISGIPGRGPAGGDNRPALSKYASAAAVLPSPTGRSPASASRWGSASDCNCSSTGASDAAEGRIIQTDCGEADCRGAVSHRSVHRRAVSGGARPPDGRGSVHQRHASEGGCKIFTAASVAADEAEDDGRTGLEFTAEMAESMSAEALRELSAVLSRIIATRNNELVALLERRDELSHERDFRQATVTALVAQVDRSQFVRHKEAEAKRRSNRR